MAIHKEKFNVLLSSDEPENLFNIVKHLKTFTGLAEVAKSKGLKRNPEITIVVIIVLFYHTEAKKAISFLQEPNK